MVGNENYPNSLKVMVNCHYHGENKGITWLFPSIIYPGLNFIGVFICGNTYILIEIRLGIRKGFPVGLEKDIVEFRNCSASAHSLEQLPWRDWSHINHWGGYFPIYSEEGYSYGKGFFFNAVKLLRCLLPEWLPHLFSFCSNSKVWCLNLDTSQFSFVLQIGSYISVKFERIVESNGELLPENLHHTWAPLDQWVCTDQYQCSGMWV